MHERSQTIQREDGKYVNVYGPGALGGAVGTPLPKRYKFEKDAYDTVHQAVHAARKRSEAEGKRGVR
jgi:hypothetical protein